MPTVPAKCTECSEIFQADEIKDAAVCPHCNTPVIIEKAINYYLGITGQHDFVIRAGALIKYNGAEDDVIIPNNVTVIGTDAFKDCTGLRSAVIPDSVVSVESSAFENCSGLTSITIPESVAFIGSAAFKNCVRLAVIAVSGDPEIEYSAFQNTPYKNETDKENQRIADENSERETQKYRRKKKREELSEKLLESVWKIIKAAYSLFWLGIGVYGIIVAVISSDFWYIVFGLVVILFWIIIFLYIKDGL